MDYLLRPLVIESSSYIKDSQHLILKTLEKEFPTDSKLFSCDFEALYTNIDHEDCLNYLSEFMKDKLINSDIKIEGFRIILNLILKNNYFKFEEKFYFQKKGIAMGSKVGPSIANIFVSFLERKWLVIHKPLHYSRFIDDIFCIVSDINDIESLKNAFGNLKLNIVSDKIVNFLDLNIKLDRITNRLVFSVFFKETNTFSYLLIDSNHPDYICKNLPKSLFIRIRRICSNLVDFSYFSSVLSYHLTLRGYDLKLINRVYSMVLDLDRSKLLEYKVRDNSKPNNIIFFKNQFNKNVINYKNIFKKAFDSFINSNEKFKPLKLQVINKMNFNLGSIFIHNFNFKTSYKNSFSKCKKIFCSTCYFFSSDYFIEITRNYFLPVFDNSDCNSENCIYIIKCSLCDVYYIGQTNNIKNRVYNHIYDIKKFEKYEKNTNKVVALHFNLKGHRLNRDIFFYIIKKDIVPEQRRLMYESFFIILFNKLNIKIINEYSNPNLKAYNHKFNLYI